MSGGGRARGLWASSSPFRSLSSPLAGFLPPGARPRERCPARAERSASRVHSPRGGRRLVSGDLQAGSRRGQGWPGWAPADPAPARHLRRGLLSACARKLSGAPNSPGTGAWSRQGRTLRFLPSQLSLTSLPGFSSVLRESPFLRSGICRLGTGAELWTLTRGWGLLFRQGASRSFQSGSAKGPSARCPLHLSLALPWRPSPCHPQPSPSCRSPLPGDTRAPKPHILVRLSDLVLDFSVQRQRVLERRGLRQVPHLGPQSGSECFHTWAHPGPGHPEALWSQGETLSWPWCVS